MAATKFRVDENGVLHLLGDAEIRTDSDDKNIQIIPNGGGQLVQGDINNPIPPNTHSVTNLDFGDNACSCIVDDGTYIWMGLGTTPAKIARVNKKNTADKTTYSLSFAGGASSITSIIDDGLHLWCSTSNSPSKLIKILKSNPGIYWYWDLDTGENACTRMVDDGTYLWMGNSTYPAKLVKVLKSDPDTRITYTMGLTENDCTALFYDFNLDMLWMGVIETPGVTPATLLLIDPSDGTSTPYTLNAGELVIRSITDDDTGNYIWLGINTSPAKLIKVDNSDPTIRQTWTCDTGENHCGVLGFAMNYLWMTVGDMSPVKLIRIDPTDPTIRSKYTFEPGEQDAFAISFDSNDIWLGLFTWPSMLVRVPYVGTICSAIGTIDMNNNGRICNVIDPIDPQDVATQASVEAAISTGTEFLRRDGTLPMTGTLDMNENTLDNVITINGGSSSSRMEIAGDVGQDIRIKPSGLGKFEVGDDPSPPDSHIVTSITSGSDVKAIVDDGTYIWLATNESPARLIRILKVNRSIQSSWVLDSGENYGRTLYDDGTYLWMGLYTSPAKLIRILKSDPTSRITYTFNSGENNITGFYATGTDFYLCLYTSPGIILKISGDSWPLSPSSHTSYTLDSGENYCTSIMYKYNADQGLYVGLYTAPAKIVRVALTMDAHSTYTLESGEDYCISIAWDSPAPSIWMGLESTPAKLVELEPGFPPAPDSHTIFELGSSNCNAIIWEGNFFYIAIGSGATYIVTFDLTSKTIIDTYDDITQFNCQTMYISGGRNLILGFSTGTEIVEMPIDGTIMELSSAIGMDYNRIVDLSDPIAPQDAATKAFVENFGGNQFLRVDGTNGMSASLNLQDWNIYNVGTIYATEDSGVSLAGFNSYAFVSIIGDGSIEIQAGASPAVDLDIGLYPGQNGRVVIDGISPTIIAYTNKELTISTMDNNKNINLTPHGTGTVVVGGEGSLIIGSSTALPAAGSTYRGQLRTVLGGAGVRDITYQCLKSASGTYSWVEILNGGF